MIKKFMLTLLLGVLCWVSSTFAMVDPSDERLRIRQSPPAAPKNLKDILDSIKHNQLALLIHQEDFDAAQSYCQQRATLSAQAQAPNVSQLFKQVERALSNSRTIQTVLPNLLLQLAPHLEADSPQSSFAQPEQTKQPAEDPLTNLTHPLIVAIQGRDFDGAQSYCQQRANLSAQDQAPNVSQLFRQAEVVFSGSESTILANLRHVLISLLPHLDENSAQSDPTSSTSHTLSYEEMAQRMRNEADAHMGTEFTRRFAREIDANYKRITTEIISE